MADFPPIKIDVVTEAEAEGAAIVVCVQVADDPGTFADNLIGECYACRAPVVFRPYMPKRPPKVCTRCLPGLLAAAQ